MINLLYSLESFQAKVQEEGTQIEPGILPALKREFGEVKVARIHGVDYWRGRHYIQRALQRSAEGSS